MESFRVCLSAAYAIMQMPLNILGYSVTLWQVFVFFAIAECLFYLFYRMMD